MLERLKRFLAGSEPNARAADKTAEDLHLAATALMVEAALQDGHVEDVELAAIRSMLQSHFAIPEREANALIEEGQRAAREATQLFEFVRAVNDALAPEERVEILEMLWQVAYADGELHDYEANLVRRVAGLLYVPDQESGSARKRVLQRLNIDPED